MSNGYLVIEQYDNGSHSTVEFDFSENKMEEHFNNRYKINHRHIDESIEEKGFFKTNWFNGWFNKQAVITFLPLIKKSIKLKITDEERIMGIVGAPTHLFDSRNQQLFIGDVVAVRKINGDPDEEPSHHPVVISFGNSILFGYGNSTRTLEDLESFKKHYHIELKYHHQKDQKEAEKRLKHYHLKIEIGECF